MRMLKCLTILFACVSAFLVSGCNENGITVRAPFTAAGPAGGDTEGAIDVWTDPVGGYSFPEILHQTFYPGDEDLFNRKCHVWKITWPDYGSAYDVTKVPTAFTPGGVLNSVYFLNNSDPENTRQAAFSLFLDNKIQRITDMGNLLTHATPRLRSDGWVAFNQHYITASAIKKMAEETPSSFEMYWQTINPVDEFTYGEGDILFYRLGTPDSEKLYGAIRILSMTPRVIEIYLAVPNEDVPQKLTFNTTKP